MLLLVFMTVPLLVRGTYNEKKGRELSRLLDPYGFEIHTLAEYLEAVDVVEDGESFTDNARLKATQQALNLKLWVLGEDSGIVVDALNGAPGIFSARFAGPTATDEENNRKLREKLAETPARKRTAHYVCHMTVCDPSGNIRAEAEARCYGRIRFQPAGNAGFGYDPLFEIHEYHQTFGQLGDSVKSVLSHRARAFEQMIPQLVELVRTQQWQRGTVEAGS